LDLEINQTYPFLLTYRKFIMNHLIWTKYLLSEQGKEEFILPANPRDYLGGNNKDEWESKFLDLFRTNRFFLASIINDIIKWDLAPRFKSKDLGAQKEIYSIIKYPGKNPMRIWDKYEYIKRKFFGSESVENFQDETLYDILTYYFVPEKREEIITSLRGTNSWYDFMTIYTKLYKNRTPPIIKSLSLTPTLPIKNNVKAIIKRFTFVDKSLLSAAPILKQVTLGEEVGSGAFGTVYDLVGQGRVMKVFESGVNLQDDVDRMQSIITQVYGGFASLEDMHYFDYGKLGESGLFYSIMPKIIPFRDFFSQERFGSWGKEYFLDLASANKITAKMLSGNSYGSYDSDGNDKIIVRRDATYPEFRGRIYHQMGKFGHTKAQINKYRETTNAIIKAGYEAFSRWGGTDLHGGNLGFLAQKPDVFFYYDM